VSVAATQRQPIKPQRWTDERLVRECVKGNQEAWSALIDRYKNLIFSIPIKLGMYQEAPDIFQAVCLDLLTNLPKLREPRALPKWLMQTCYHKCVRHNRHAENQVSLEGHTDNVRAENDAVPDEILVQLQQEQMLRNVISELSQRCSDLIRMLFFETPPRPYHAIADELGLATGSIGFIRGRCLTKLRKQLQEKGF
jgi:RNA polymerase sigma factor (sigma-70 family)